MRDSFVFYRSFGDAARTLPDEERLKLFDALIGYALDDEEPDLTGVTSGMMALMKPVVDANSQRFENGKKGAEGGKLGGRPKKTPMGLSEKTPMGLSAETPNKDVNEDVNEDVHENVNEDVHEDDHGERPARRFAPPSVDEVRAYCQERRNQVDPERFVDFYASNGWKVGKNPMKDWRAAVRTWEKRDDNKPQAPPGRTLTDAQARHARLMQIAGGMT